MWNHATSRPVFGLDPLSIRQLEAGLRLLDGGGAEAHAFFDENVSAFRQTIVLAIRETSDALLQPRLSEGWRAELADQIEALRRCADLTDRYIARQARAARLN